jgi:hypothetical protein
MKKSTNYKILFMFAAGILIGAAVIALLPSPVDDKLAVSPPTETIQKDAAVSGQSSVHVEIADLKREVSLLSQHLTSLENKVISRAMEQSSTTSAPADEEPKLSAEDEQKQAKAQQKERLQLINHSFHTEQKDPDWSKQAASTINNAISSWSNSKSSSKYVLKQAECRSSLCRVEINFSDSEGLSSFKQEFTRNLGASLPGMTMSANQNGDGTVTGIAYLVREGKSFPEYD